MEQTVSGYISRANLLLLFVSNPLLVKDYPTNDSNSFNKSTNQEFQNIRKEIISDYYKCLLINTTLCSLIRFGIKRVSRPTKLKTIALGFTFGSLAWGYWADLKLDLFLREQLAKNDIDP